MSAENKAIPRRLIEEGFNQGNLDVFDELVAPDFVNHSAPPGVPPTREGWKQIMTIFRTAFPDIHSPYRGPDRRRGSGHDPVDGPRHAPR